MSEVPDVYRTVLHVYDSAYGPVAERAHHVTEHKCIARTSIRQMSMSFLILTYLLMTRSLCYF
jgi:hypothetical protein